MKPIPALGVALSTVCLAMLALVPIAETASQAMGQTQPTRIEAITKPSRDLELAFNISGRVMQTLVEPGDRVEAGQPLIRLDDREARIRLRLHQLRSQSTAAIDAAQATLDLTRDELTTVQEALAKDGANQREVARQQLEVDRAQASLLIEQLKREEAELEFEAAAVQLEKYTLNAPVAGFVETLLPRSGETVEALAPVLRLVATDPLELEAAVPANNAMRLAPQSTVWVSLFLSGHEKYRPATVLSLSQVADGPTSSRIIRIALPNPEGIPAGIRADIRLERPEPSLLAQTE